MAQSDSSDKLQSLFQAIHRIALDPTLENAVPQILGTAAKISQAEAAFFVIFEEPYTLITHHIQDTHIPDATDLRSSATLTSNGFNIEHQLPEKLKSQYQGWSCIPLELNKELVGVLCLLFQETINLSEQTIQQLSSLHDSLLLIAKPARMKARHDRQIRNQQEFMRIVSHDLRSPLTSMQGFASMLESLMVGDLNEKQAHFVDKILSGIQQLSSQVDNIQDAGRYDPETGFYEMEREACDLFELVGQIVTAQLVPAEKQELTISINAADDIPIINVDSAMLERALINLIDNAIKYTPNGGDIEVGIRLVDNEIHISVKDSGLGIGEEHVTHLFERHFRVHRREYRQVKGSGLGLFIVYSVAQHHGGRAWVESKEGSGSTFLISIPLEGKNLFVPDTDTAEV